jgi:hypothetical protein
MKRSLILFVLAALVVPAACVTMPSGPTVAVMPGPEKPFEVFQEDDAVCRQWALQQIGGAPPGESSGRSVAGGAIAGTALGAGLGAALGAASGNAGAGAAIGAGTGLLAGTAVGSGSGYDAEYELQRRYDIAYQQCMYTKGNQIPGVRPPQYASAPPPPPSPSGPAGKWVTMPGQTINGVWVPEHKVYVPNPAAKAPAPGG